MKLILPILFLLCSYPSFAQSNRFPPRDEAKSIGEVRQAIPSETSSFGTYDKSVVADTIFPTILASQCAIDSITLFTPGGDGMGFVVGTNSFFDLAKIQRITLPEATNFSINQALVAFAVADETIANRKVVVDIFAGLDTAGNPTGFAGSSDTLLVSDLIVPDQGLVFTSFPFTTPAELTDAGSFLLSVNMLDLYFNDLDSLDYAGNVAIFSTVDGCGDGMNTLETFAVQGGLSTASLFTNWGGLNTEMYVGAIIERDPFTSTRTPLADYAAVVAPNPAYNAFTLTFRAAGNDLLNASLLTTDGRVVRSQSVSAVTGRVNWAVADLPAGLYLYQISGAAGVQTGKVVIR